jgi:hypothetical protein
MGDARAQQLADTRRDEDIRARRSQERDAARIHRELVDADRITAAIDDLVGGEDATG